MNSLSQPVVLFLFVFFTLSVTYGQIESAKIVYGGKMMSSPIDTSSIENQNMKSYMVNEMAKIKKGFQGVTFILDCTNEESNFEAEGYMENDVNPYIEDAIQSSNGNGLWYRKVVTNEIVHQIEFSGKAYILDHSKREIDWVITGESKMILGYKCLKATANAKMNSRVSKQIIAWFSQEIPLSYGPMRYGGLPGLILEIDERGLNYFAKKIILNGKATEIIKPDKGIKMSIEEFEGSLSKAY